ncbi:hypothetical protein [Streptomyces sp. UNOC14_S4]|uniref:hypothetical protein n=1 Tax=Streptomyces sp. UNOC14_S4 TaxID=2872340 RepID=UPI001E326A75|nr:hypothetical protein [Streptomyces sp. UNOC14_S4]MCC3769753.1 hypothetical protein [Streptomyces sp. UNOC14_S4]
MSDLAPTGNHDLPRFLRQWYGEPTSPGADTGGAQRSIPGELTEWHGVAAQWDGVITPQNYAIPLQDLKIEDGKVPFWAENQGTRLWAFDPEDRGHAVYEREPGEDPGPWLPVGEKLSDFLVHATILEAIFGAPASKMPQGVDVEFLVARTEAEYLAFSEWRWPAPGSRVMRGENWLALVHPSGSPGPGYDVMLAALSLEDLAWTDRFPEIRWQSFSDSDSASAEPLPW